MCNIGCLMTGDQHSGWWMKWCDDAGCYLFCTKYSRAMSDESILRLIVKVLRPTYPQLTRKNIIILATYVREGIVKDKYTKCLYADLSIVDIT